VLPVSPPSTLPPLCAISRLLIRPVQPVQWIPEVFVRPGTHHQHLKNRVPPGRVNRLRLRKKGVVVSIVLLFWATQRPHQQESKNKKHDQEHTSQEESEAHGLSYPFPGRLMMTSSGLAWAEDHLSESAALPLLSVLPGKESTSITINATSE
jgi:hypothetical protein